MAKGGGRHFDAPFKGPIGAQIFYPHIKMVVKAFDVLFECEVDDAFKIPNPPSVIR